VKHELSDMLRDAKSNPPPPRYTVDDALAAGRKRQKQRRALWAGTGSAAVVLAVAGAVAVPQIISQNNDQKAPPAAAAENKPKTKAAFQYPSGDFTGTLAKYKAGEFTVTGTSLVTPGYQVASITAPGKGQKNEGNDKKIYYSPNVVGHLITYKKGAFDPGKAKKDSKVSAGYFHEGAKQKPLKPGFPAGYDDSTLTFEYADDAWAQIIVQGGEKYTAERLAPIVKGLTAGDETPVKLGFKLGYVPNGYELTSAGESTNYLESTFPGQSYAQLVKGDVSFKNLTGTIGDSFIVGDKQLPTLQFQVFPAWEQKYSAHGDAAYCASEGLCYAYTKDKKFFLEASGGGFVSDSELLKVLNSVEFADPTDTSTWFPATEAIS
jgi:hypothetical protein